MRLHAAGIPGIRFLDGDSRTDGKGSYKLREIQVTNILKEVRARIAVSIAAKQPLPTASKNLIFSVSYNLSARWMPSGRLVVRGENRFLRATQRRRRSRASMPKPPNKAAEGSGTAL